MAINSISKLEEEQIFKLAEMHNSQTGKHEASSEDFKIDYSKIRPDLVFLMSIKGYIDVNLDNEEKYCKFSNEAIQHLNQSSSAYAR